MLYMLPRVFYQNVHLYFHHEVTAIGLLGKRPVKYGDASARYQPESEVGVCLRMAWRLVTCRKS